MVPSPVQFDPSGWFAPSFKKFYNQDQNISNTLKEFKRHHNNGWPLPRSFQDHVLDPPFDGSVRECHLSNDILLIYRVVSPNLIQLLEVVNHARIIRGSKSEMDLAKRHKSTT